RQRLGLQFEAPQAIRIAPEILWQYLDGHVAIESRIARAKYFAHPARADAGGNRVRANPSPRVHSLYALETLFIFQRTGEAQSNLAVFQNLALWQTETRCLIMTTNERPSNSRLNGM